MPFSSSQDLVINDINQYVPGEVSIQTYTCSTPRTHCYVCGEGWGFGYWKHCWCKPNQVPIGDGMLVLLTFSIIYVLIKKFKK